MDDTECSRKAKTRSSVMLAKEHAITIRANPSMMASTFMGATRDSRLKCNGCKTENAYLCSMYCLIDGEVRLTCFALCEDAKLQCELMQRSILPSNIITVRQRLIGQQFTEVYYQYYPRCDICGWEGRNNVVYKHVLKSLFICSQCKSASDVMYYGELMMLLSCVVDIADVRYSIVALIRTVRCNTSSSNTRIRTIYDDLKIES